ncbi:MAG TPA: hypothetical protein VLL25_05500 [Acidimicrobiales bacterium]|nr:hypothetical protein [Acidimicrobiales bacterium]
MIAVAVLGGIDVLVAPGIRVTMEGFTLLGNREARVVPGEGPELHMWAVAILGGVGIKEKPAP